ncbi:MAG: pilus assembly protein [Hyphomicrobiales bacterium]|nr:pilus assembly protein [Hyphomicrobiales bacterium]
MDSRNERHPYGPGRKPARPSLIARFIGNRKGSTAIEFTILAIPFALLVFAILESCVAFAAQQLLSNATDDIAREVRTGQLTTANLDETKLRDMFCGKMSIMVGSNCDAYVHFDLESYGSFADVAAVRTTVENGALVTTGFKVLPGGPLTINMLRVYYEWPVMTDLMTKLMSNLSNGRTLLFATATWQNEPF